MLPTLDLLALVLAVKDLVLLLSALIALELKVLMPILSPLISLGNDTCFSTNSLPLYLPCSPDTRKNIP